MPDTGKDKSNFTKVFIKDKFWLGFKLLYYHVQLAHNGAQ